MKRTITLLALAFALSQVHAQQHQCPSQGHTKAHLERMGLSTGLFEHLPLPAGTAEERGGTVTIPVVVHVVWNTAAENVSDATILQAIQQLNMDFAAMNSDVSQVRPAFSSAVANTNIQFCLAQVNPQGLPTTGIVRKQTSVSWFDPDTMTDDMKFNPQGSPAWNPNLYLNIWICDISSGMGGGFVTAGYAYLPVMGVPGTNIDGIVLDYDYGVGPGSRTLTHEMGHYLGLLHTWGEDPGSCQTDDGFTDTPNTNSPTYSCTNTTLQKCGALTQYENHMDYSSCRVMFTNQQSAYMNGILNGVRSSLLGSTACGNGGGDLPCIPTSAQGTTDGDFIDGVVLGSINNTGSGSEGGPSYHDYTAIHSTSLQQGSSHSIAITGGAYLSDNYAVWIDYDQNGVFAASEKLGEFTTSAPFETQNIAFTVSAGAAPGNTVMRVRGVYHNTGEPTPTDPCFNYAWGETEDYRIIITTQGGGDLPCIPTSAQGTTDGDFIDGVVLGSINNTGSGSEGGPSYHDYTAIHSTSLQQGSSHSIAITGGAYLSDNYAVWIDYDQNGVFAASEKLGEFTTSAPFETQNIAFTVPAGAAPGNTVMRVRGVYHGTGEPTPTDPCFNYTWGETEDYRIIITTQGGGDLPCIPTSAQGTTDGDFIDGVVLGSINNTGSGSEGGPSYHDYTAIHSTSLQQGSSHSIAITGGAYLSDNYAVWIDYDQNGVFAASEKLGEFTTSAPFETQNIAFTVPAGAAPGNTVMRVRGVYHGTGEPTPTDPCFNYTWGETEDYRIIITTQGGGGYCIPEEVNGTTDGDFINGVVLGDIVNENTGGAEGPAYNDYTGQSTMLPRGTTHTISIQGGEYQPDNYAVWIDYDQNGVFASSEKLGEFTTNALYQTQSIDFTVPMNATLGSTRMRVRGVYIGLVDPSPTDPCFGYAWGETEDYTVVITTSVGVPAQDGGAARLYPNPTAGNLTVELPGVPRSQAQVLDLSGRVVADGLWLEGRTDLALGQLASGRYILRCFLPEGPLSLPFQVVR